MKSSGAARVPVKAPLFMQRCCLLSRVSSGLSLAVYLFFFSVVSVFFLGKNTEYTLQPLLHHPLSFHPCYTSLLRDPRSSRGSAFTTTHTTRVFSSLLTLQQQQQQDSSASPCTYFSSFHYWSVSLAECVSSSCASRFPSVAICRSIFSLSAGVRTPRQHSSGGVTLFFRLLDLLKSVFSDVWELLHILFSGSSSSAPLTSVCRHDATISTSSLQGLLLLLPHTLPAAATVTSPGVPTPEATSDTIHSDNSHESSKTDSNPLLRENDGQDEATGKRVLPFSDDILKHFYSSFPEPHPPPGGIVELDAATWDIIANVMSTPFEQKHQQQQQHETRKEEQSSSIQASEQESQQLVSSGEHNQEQQLKQQQQQQTTGSAPVSSSSLKLMHSVVPTPPRLWLVAFMASGCTHCQRLRPVLQQLQRLYSRRLQQLRAARRLALEREQQKATAALSVASKATADAHKNLRQLSRRRTPEGAIKAAEHHAVTLQQEEQTLQQKLLLRVSQLYAGAATAAWAYPDIVFATFDCMQNRQHQALCGQVFKVSRFPTVLLLRTLPQLSTLAARAAEEPPLYDSLLCPSSLLRNRRSSAAAHVSSAAAAASSNGAAIVDRLISVAAQRTSEGEEDFHSFSSAPLLRERLGQHRRHASAAAGTATAENLRNESGGEKTGLLCALQEELLAEFISVSSPSLKRLLLFVYGSAAEVASWAPVVPPPTAFLQHLLLSGSASLAATSAPAADPATSQGMTREALRMHNAAVEKEEADALSAAASTAAIFLQKEERRKYSNNFLTWLANRMRGEAVRQVVSAEEARLLHYGTSTVADITNSGCGSPTVSFLVCLDLPRVLQTERGGDSQSTLRVSQQYQPHRQQQQQQRQKQENMRREAVAGVHAVRLDGLRDAFETFADAAGVLRREHMFLYSLDPAACSPRVLRTRDTFAAAAQQLLLKKHERSATPTDTVEAIAQSESVTASSIQEETIGDNDGGNGNKWEQHPLRVMALQPGLLRQEENDSNTCEGSEQTDETAGAADGGDERKTEMVDDDEYEDDQQQDEVERSSVVGEQHKVLLLQHILQGVWTAQRNLAFQQHVKEDETGRQERETTVDSVYKDTHRRERKTCSAQEGQCVDPQEQQQQQQHSTYVPQLHQQRQDENCVLEENESIEAMQLPIFVGPFPRRVDDLKTTASGKGPSAADIASFFATTPSPPLASFLDVFRSPTLPLIGQENFMHLRVSSSSSWLSAAGSGGTSSSSSTRKDMLEVGRRQLVMAALDLRVLDMLLTLFQKSQIAAAVVRALQQQQQAVTLARMHTAAAAGNSDAEDVQPSEDKEPVARDTKSRSPAAERKPTGSSSINSHNTSTSVSDSNRSENSSSDGSGTSSGSSSGKSSNDGWLGTCLYWLSYIFIPQGGSSESVDELSREPLVASGSSPFSAASDPKSVDLVAAALSGGALNSSKEYAAATATASRLLKLVNELWQLSSTVRGALLRSHIDLLQPQNRDKDDRDSRHSSSHRSPMTVFAAPFLFGILDGFGYSDSLADFDVDTNEEGELPAVLAFDPLLPSSGGESNTSSHSCNGSNKESCNSAGASTDQWNRSDDTSHRNDGSSSMDRRGADGGEATSAGRRTKSGRNFVPYYYRDRQRLRLEDLPLGLSLLRVRALQGRRMAEEEDDEEDNDEEGSVFLLFGRVFRGFARMGRRIASWLRKEYKAASRSRLALLRLIFSLCAFFLVLACTVILVLYTVFCPTKSTAEVEDESESEADTADTADLDTEAEENEEDEEEEEIGADSHEKDSTTPGNSGGDNAEDTCQGDENETSNTLDSSTGNSSTTTGSSGGNKAMSEEPEVWSVEEVQRRAEKMLRKRR